MPEKESQIVGENVRLVEIDGMSATVEGATRGTSTFLARVRQNIWFVLVVLIPATLGGLYFGLVASDQYLSEARFIVRQADGQQYSPLDGLLVSAGLSSSQNDTLAIQDFILSRDAVRKLEEDLNLRLLLDRPEADFLSRFPNVFDGGSTESLHSRFPDFVNVTIDSSSGIGTLGVKAFRADDAQQMALALLQYSEELVNRINERAQQDLVELAKSEVNLAEERVIAAQLALTEFRQRTSIVDPVAGSTTLLELVGALSAELATAETMLAQILSAAPDSPQIVPLRRRIAALEKQIADERSKVVGDESSIVVNMSEYERLLLQREFAEQGMQSAISTLEAARLEAQRKHIYLERIVEPNLADDALYPKRLYNFIILLVSVLLIFGIGRLVSASVQEHVGR